MRIGVRAVATRGFVLDLSRLGSARLYSDEAAARFKAFQRSNPKRSQDALVAETALQEGPVLVTEENAQGSAAYHVTFCARSMAFDEFRAWIVGR